MDIVDILRDGLQTAERACKDREVRVRVGEVRKKADDLKGLHRR